MPIIYPDERMRRWEVGEEVIIADADNYYTKSQVDKKIEEITVSGVTEEKAQEMIDESLQDYYSKENVDAIVSDLEAADSVISGAVDNLSSDILTESQRAISAESALDEKIDTKADANSVYTKTEIDNIESVQNGKIDAVSGSVNTLDSKIDTVSGNLQTQIEAIETELEGDYASKEWVSGYTYSKAVTEDMIEDYASNYTYDKQTIDNMIDTKADTATTYTKDEVNGLVSNLEAADSVISGAVDNVSSGLITEAQRAQNAESQLNSKIETVSGNVNAVDTKVNTVSGNLQTQIEAIETELEGDYASKEWVSGYTYDKQTIEDMIEESGGFIPENYYDKDATDALLDEKLDITAYTPTDLSNYYTKSETSGKTEIQTALNAKADAATTYTKTEVDNAITSATNDMATKTWVGNQNYALRSEIPDISGKQDISGMTAYTENSAFVAHTSNTTVHITSNERTAWNNKSDFSGSYNDLTDKPTIPVVPTNVSAFNNDSGYITSNAISGKADTSAVTEAISAAVSGKADSNTVYTKTEVDTALNQKQNTLTAGSGITISNNVISAKIWSGTKSQYEALTTKDSDTIYLIYNE